MTEVRRKQIRRATCWRKPKVEIHQTVESDGVAQMLPVEAIEIAPGQTVTLQPGGFHVMFMGLDGRQLQEGEEVPATLVFEKAGELAVVFKVEKRSDGTTMKHGDYNAAPSN